MRVECEFTVWDNESHTFISSASELRAELPPTMFKRPSGEIGLETADYPRGFYAIKAFWASVNTFHRLNGGKYSLTAFSKMKLLLNTRGLEPLREFGVQVKYDSLHIPGRLYKEPENLRALCRAIVALKNGEPISERDRKILSIIWEEVYVRTEECGWPLLVEFSDEWSSTNKEVFLSLLQGLETSEPMKLYLYGLRKDRGDVWAIPTAPEEYRLKGEFPKPVRLGNTIYLGVPYSFRKEKVDLAFLKEVVSWIRQTLSSYVGGQQ